MMHSACAREGGRDGGRKGGREGGGRKEGEWTQRGRDKEGAHREKKKEHGMLCYRRILNKNKKWVLFFDKSVHRALVCDMFIQCTQIPHT